MPFWTQNASNQWPRNGTAQTNSYPRGVPVYDAANIPQSMENPASTSPGGGYRAQPLRVGVQPSFGTHDGLHGAMMAVSQADTYNAAPNPFPACGVWDQPGAGIAASMMVRLAPTTSAHPGLQNSTGAGPVMMFTAPPVFSVQTRPIYAVGL